MRERQRNSLIQFSFIYTVSATIKIVSRCFIDNQGLNPNQEKRQDYIDYTAFSKRKYPFIKGEEPGSWFYSRSQIPGRKQLLELLGTMNKPAGVCGAPSSS